MNFTHFVALPLIETMWIYALSTYTWILYHFFLYLSTVLSKKSKKRDGSLFHIFLRELPQISVLVLRISRMKCSIYQWIISSTRIVNWYISPLWCTSFIIYITKTTTSIKIPRFYSCNTCWKCNTLYTSASFKCLCLYCS